DVTPEGLSSWLGNNGGYCTLTKECMPSCNG
ncbi:mersacidin/lichenicidin family type 2 lantibiotic, partial [Bacillus cereus]